jgi:hypothetical protein
VDNNAQTEVACTRAAYILPESISEGISGDNETSVKASLSARSSVAAEGVRDLARLRRVSPDDHGALQRHPCLP